MIRGCDIPPYPLIHSFARAQKVADVCAVLMHGAQHGPNETRKCSEEFLPEGLEIGKQCLAIGLHAGEKKTFTALFLGVRKNSPQVLVKYVCDENGRRTGLHLPEVRKTYVMPYEVHPWMARTKRAPCSAKTRGQLACRADDERAAVEGAARKRSKHGKRVTWAPLPPPITPPPTPRMRPMKETLEAEGSAWRRVRMVDVDDEADGQATAAATGGSAAGEMVGGAVGRGGLGAAAGVAAGVAAWEAASADEGVHEAVCSVVGASREVGALGGAGADAVVSIKGQGSVASWKEVVHDVEMRAKADLPSRPGPDLHSGYSTPPEPSSLPSTMVLTLSEAARYIAAGGAVV